MTALSKPSPIQNMIIEFAIWKMQKDARNAELDAQAKDLQQQIARELTAEKFHARAGTAAHGEGQS